MQAVSVPFFQIDSWQNIIQLKEAFGNSFLMLLQCWTSTAN